MNKSLTITVALIAAVVLLSDGASAKRLRTNPNRGKYSSPAAVEESTDETHQIDTDELQEKFSFPDPSAKNFKTLESDRKSFGVSSGSNSHFSDLSSSFGKGLKKKKKPSYATAEEDDDEGSYEVNYKTTVTHKPSSSFDSGSYKFPSLSSSSSSPKTKFGSSSKFSSFNHQGSGSSQSGIFKLNEPSTGQITTKFAINHPAPTHTASSLGGSYQTFPDDGSYGSSQGHLTEKFISDYQSALSKLKSDHHSKNNEHPKFEAAPSFKTKFRGDDGSNFKVSSDFKVGSESHPTQFHKSSKHTSPDLANFKPNFRLQEVPNLYPSDDQFRPSIGFSESGHGIPSNSKLFEPSSDNNNEFVKQQLAQNPASKGQYQQFLKSQEDEKIEQQALLEQLKYQQLKQQSGPIKGHGRPLGFSGSSTKFRPYVNVKSFNTRRKPVRVISSPGLGHYRTPIIDGPYTIHFSV